MTRHPKLWLVVPVASALSLGVGYALPRPEKKGGDMLDAVAAAQRRCPLYLIPERGCPPSWVTEGGIYLSRTGKTVDEVEHLEKDPRGYDDRWHGVVYFKACVHRDRADFPILSGPRERVLDYGDFAVYGDPELLQVVCPILESAGFQAAAASCAESRSEQLAYRDTAE
jgi:hypothetical protein